MKKYFAKYLPVEGEIRGGDTYSQDYYSKGQIGVANGNDYKDGAYKDKQKVKLFLCSRDIQVGDEVYYKNTKCTFINREINDGYPEFVFDNNEIYHPPTYDQIWDKNEPPFRIIGEISSDATWVKEGDEFDEEEIRIIYQRRNGYSEETEKDLLPWYSVTKDHYENHPQKESRYFRILVKILGPCKHFH